MEKNLWFQSKSGKPIHLVYRTTSRHIEGKTEYFYLDIDDEQAEQKIPVPANENFSQYTGAEGSLDLIDERDARPVFEKFMEARKAERDLKANRGRPKKEVT
jgi:hypothetical protein